MVSGVVAESGLERLVLSLPGTDYRLHLVMADGVAPPEAGSRVTGVVRARALRVDVVGAGGRYVEPVFGRPRRVQGRIVGGDPRANELHVSAGPVMVITPTAPGQKAADFLIGQLVSFDVERGASFEPVSPDGEPA